MKARRHQAGGDHRDAGALERRRHVTGIEPLADAGEQDQHQREADRAAGTEEQRFDEVVLLLHVEQRNPQHRAVGGDQRQIDAQHLVQHRAGLVDEHLGKLDDPGDHHDERQRAQVEQLGAEQVLVDEVAGAGGQRQHEGRRQPHADRRFQFLRHAHEGAQAENLGHHDVVHEHRGNEDEEVGFQNGLIRTQCRIILRRGRAIQAIAVRGIRPPARSISRATCRWPRSRSPC